VGLEGPVDALLEVAARRLRVREPHDEQLALELIGRLGLTEGAPALSARAFGLVGVTLDPFRWTALGALARLGDPRALGRIERALGARSPRQVALALGAAALSGHAELREFVAAVGRRGAADPELVAETLERLAAAPPGGRAD
jgi:hypothetical protein